MQSQCPRATWISLSGQESGSSEPHLGKSKSWELLGPLNIPECRHASTHAVC